MKNVIILFVLLIAIAGLSGCGKAPEHQHSHNQPANIHKADECQLCGMMIAEFPGPKGQLFEKGQTVARKFCSTRDMFSYYLQPENRRLASQIYVHDMSEVPWDQPKDSEFIDAKAAWFVLGSSKKGAMGSTLASFKDKAKAEHFAKSFGGEVIGFDDVTLTRLMD